ncbi:MAG: dihydroneopterin aldolase [Calditrichaeota bacterium]|nr:dihydroneopterin aldolase [Calditrichota bacterium]
MDVIRITGMVFYAYHGVESEEKKLGQRFEVDVEVFLDTRRAGNTDDLVDTVNYVTIYEIVEEIVIEGEYNLIEAIAEDIARLILERLPVEKTLVRVRKPHVSLPGIVRGVEVEIVRG